MRKLLTKIASALLGLSLALGVGAIISSPKHNEVKAADLELTFDVSSNPGEWPTANDSTLTEYTYSLNDVDYTFGLLNVKCNSGYLMLTQPAALGLPAIAGYKLTKVVASNSSGCSQKTVVGISSSSSSASYIAGGSTQTWATVSSSYTYNLTSTEAGTMYFLYVTTKNAQILSISLSYEQTGSSGPAKLTTPSPLFDNISKEVSWGNVSNASHYEVSVDNESSYVTATSPYDVKSLSLDVEHTVYVKAIGDGSSYSDSDAGHVTFTPTAVVIKKYALVKSVADLTLNKSYIITNGVSGTVNAMSTTTNGDNRKVTSVSVVDSKITETSSLLSLTLGGSSGAYTFHTENYEGTAGYLNATNTTEKNYLRVTSSLDDYAYFSIAFDGDAAVITCTGKSSRNILMCNSSGTPMSCYTSGQDPVYLWKEIPAADIPLTDIGLVATETVIVGQTVTLSPIFTPEDANTKTSLSWSTSDDKIATVADGVVTGVKEGTVTITVDATDISKSASCVVTVNPVPPVEVDNTIAECYTIAKGSTVSFNGMYMGCYGTNPSNGIFLADGDYGIMVYGTSTVPSGWEVGSTVLAVSGTTDFFNGLVQIKNATFQATSGTVSTPVVYAFTGSENSAVALSRKTSLSGTVTGVNGTFAKASDTTVTVDIGNEKSAKIFIKKNSFTDEQLANYADKFAVNNYVVVTGFLNYYNTGTTAVTDTYDSSKFQIIIPTIVSTTVYTADAFATDFKNATKTACESEENARLSGLQAVWTDVSASYSVLSETEKQNFVDSGANENIKDALARYCHICGKYNTSTVKVLEEFVEGASIVYKAPTVVPSIASSQNTASTIIIVVVALTSITSIGVLLVIKRKRSLVK